MTRAPRLRRRAATLLIIATLLSCGTRVAMAGETVLTALQPVHALATALAEGTGIAVEGVPQPLAGMNRLGRVLARADAALDARLKSGSAVVGVGSVWPEDPLFREARSRNIRVVGIDAARSIDRPAMSVAVVARPASDPPWRPRDRVRPAITPDQASAVAPGSPYVWFSLANAAKMAEIMAGDLKRLSPPDAARLDANLARLTADLLALRTEYEQRILSLRDTRLFALTERFVYLTNEFGFDVEGYFLEDDVRWTSEDYVGLARLLRERGVKVVLHHWQPAEGIRKAIADGGARLVVLDDFESSAPPNGKPVDSRAWRAAFRTNLDALCAALAE